MGSWNLSPLNMTCSFLPTKSEGDEVTSRVKETLRALLDYSHDKTILDADDATSSIQDLDSNIDFSISIVRGSSNFKTSSKLCEQCKLSSSEDVFYNNAIFPKERPSLTESEISDVDFFDSDAGKEMILKDQENMENELSLQNDYLNCTACSSWIPVSSKKSSELPFLPEKIRKSQLTTSVGEYIGIRTESLGSLSENSMHQKEFFGCDASTPNEIRSKNPDFDFSNEMTERFSKFNISPQSTPVFKAFAFPMFLYSVAPKEKKSENLEGLSYYIGSPYFENIKKLKAKEEMQVKLAESADSETDKTIENVTRDSENNSSESFQSACNKSNEAGEWIIKPQEVMLDTTKGSRVLMINNSSDNIKFKTKFDVQILNVCPLYGTIRAKSQIGLRILVSRSQRKQKKTSETTIKVTSGSREKLIHVKIFEAQKSRTVKERSFMLH